MMMYSHASSSKSCTRMNAVLPYASIFSAKIENPARSIERTAAAAFLRSSGFSGSNTSFVSPAPTFSTAKLIQTP